MLSTVNHKILATSKLVIFYVGVTIKFDAVF